MSSCRSARDHSRKSRAPQLDVNARYRIFTGLLNPKTFVTRGHLVVCTCTFAPEAKTSSPQVTFTRGAHHLNPREKTSARHRCGRANFRGPRPCPFSPHYICAPFLRALRNVSPRGDAICARGTTHENFRVLADR